MFLRTRQNLHGTDDSNTLATADYTRDAVDYLLDSGMAADEIAALRNMITKDPE